MSSSKGWQRQCCRAGAVACAAIIGFSVARSVCAQDPESSAAPVVAPAAEAPAIRVLPANTPIPLLFDETLVSGVNAPGSTFRMVVTDDIRIEGNVVIPAGTVAFGEVVDSKKAGMLGKAGVLVLSARFVHLDHRDIRLHSALGAAGDSMTVAALFVPFIRGKQASVERGTRVVVRTAGDERF